MRTIQGNWHQEYGKLKAKIEVLSKSQRFFHNLAYLVIPCYNNCFRHLMGEQLDSLSHKELQQLENQLDNSLKHIRSRKNQVVFDSITELQRKEKALQEQNKSLEKQVNPREAEGQGSHPAAHWEQAQTSSSSPPFLLADADHTLNIGQVLPRKGNHRRGGRSCRGPGSDQWQHIASLDAQPFEWLAPNH
ncbi:hypothetical protein ZIOFF_028482 [Zingiber officinale]|uniref:K-box domain-containing protein n=1 Tax=Zingiber officinale TaxID=94328 RepID=A0A8J5GVZ7_ZINOF|nr:hypothetical protein ZIOFF_028482 [Zingiber officinale]